jgi:hypothetical protein
MEIIIIIITLIIVIIYLIYMNSKNNELELFTNCETWAKNGECDKNPNYMGKYCQKECSLKTWGAYNV